MASTYSALKIELIGTGDQAGVWGNTTNVNLGDGGAGLEQAIVGMATLVTADFTANSYTLPYTDTNALQDFRALVLNVTATLSNNGEVVVPAIQKPYLVFNNSVGGYSVTFKVSGQPGVTVPNGYKCYVYNNGTDVIQASDFMPAITANQIDILAQGDLRLQDASGGQYVAIQAPATIASSYTLTMPTDDGSSNQVLTTDGNGVLSWTSLPTGAVTAVSVVSANGLAGTSSGGTTPALTLSTTVTGVLKGNGTAISAATSGVDYAPATSGTSILKGNGSGGFSNAAAGTDYAAATTGTNAQLLANNGSGGFSNVTVGSGLSYSAGTLSASASSTLSIDNKTANYTVISSDNGKVINCTTNGFTVSLDAAATLGAGFNVTIWNNNTSAANTITIDPNGSETIDGKSTIVLRRGEGLQIVCDGTNWQTGNKKTMRAYTENITSTLPPSAGGEDAVAIGRNSSAGGQDGFAIGPGASAGGLAGMALGRSTSAGSNYSLALGSNSGPNGSVTASGAGAVAIGGSYASGTDSFAAAVANNTSSYGATGAYSIAIGRQARSTSGGAAIGPTAVTTANSSCAIGNAVTVSGFGSTVLGDGNTLSASESFCAGTNNNIAGYYSYNLGSFNVATSASEVGITLGVSARVAQKGKVAYASGGFASNGDCQTGTYVLRRATTDATPTVLTTNNSAPDTSNIVILANSSTYTFRIQVVGMQQAAGGTNTAGYSFEGVIRRGANAAATVLKNSTKTVIQEDVAGWDVNVSADTTNGGLAITVTGAAATNIRWVATVQTTEVTYA